MHAYCAVQLHYADLNLLNPPPLAFLHKEALYEDVWSVRCKPQEKDECKRESIGAPDLESPDKTIKVGDRIYATTLCPPPAVAEIWDSQTTSQCLAKVFAANSQPKPFCSTVSDHLHNFEDIFSKVSFDSLLECKQLDHAIELIPDAEPSSCKVYPLHPQMPASLYKPGDSRTLELLVDAVHDLLPEPQTSFPATLLSQSSPNIPSNSPNLCLNTAPTLANSDTSSANLNSPLASSDTFPTALNPSSSSSEPLEPSSTVPDASPIFPSDPINTLSCGSNVNVPSTLVIPSYDGSLYEHPPSSPPIAPLSHHPLPHLSPFSASPAPTKANPGATNNFANNPPDNEQSTPMPHYTTLSKSLNSNPIPLETITCCMRNKLPSPPTDNNKTSNY
ncbi:hypothetical protein E4T56_gene11979 [Termitomyces sp. T112]|nr:hypothetical protein E4T56_gene11979 [Termitomyces sp. T112]